MPHDPAAPRQSAPAARVSMRGYVLSEDDEFALKDVAGALRAVSAMCDDVPSLSEIPAGQMSSLMRVLARAMETTLGRAGFANEAKVRSRDIN